MLKVVAYATGLVCFEVEDLDGIRINLDCDGELDIHIRNTDLGAASARRIARALLGAADKIAPTPVIAEPNLSDLGTVTSLPRIPFRSTTNTGAAPAGRV